MNTIDRQKPLLRIKLPHFRTAAKPRRWAHWLAAAWFAGALPALALETGILITKDTYLDSRAGSQESNYGLNNAVRVLVNSDSSVTRGLFGIPEELRAYGPGELLEAKVYFYVFQDNTKTRDIRLYPLTNSFVEGSGGRAELATGATWFTRDGTNHWATAGGDFDADHFVVGVKGPILDVNLNDRFFSWDITALLTNALTRANLLTHGAILIIDGEDRPPATSSDRAPFTSSESLDNPVEFRPRITVTPRGPVLSVVKSGPDAVRLDIAHALPSRLHRIERSFDPTSPTNWTEAATLLVSGTETNWTEAALGAGTNVFYRVVVEP